MSTTNTFATITITTASGSWYLFDGERVARLSERPIRGAEDLMLNGVEVADASPVVIGWAWHFRPVGAGGTVSTTAVVSVEGELAA